MRQDDLLGFLGTARDLEASHALLERAEAEANSCIDELSNRERPAFEPPNSNIPQEEKNSFYCMIKVWAAIGFAVGVAFCFVNESGLFNRTENPISNFLFTILFVVGIALYGAVGAGVGAIPGALCGYVSSSSKRKKLEAENNEALMIWKKEDEELRKRVEATVREFQATVKDIGEVKDIVGRIRASHYEDGPVYRKYRTLPAICQLYEYFESERFTDLGSAYNQYELEVRLDRIVDRLDEALASLNQIMLNQRVLYDVLIGMQSTLDEISRSMNRCARDLDSIARSQEVSSICLQQTALATTLLSQVAYYKNRHDLPFALDFFEGALVGINARLLMRARKMNSPQRE